MKYEKLDGTTHIYADAENGETQQEVLRAIVKASFELARPAGLGWLHFKAEQLMGDEDADGFIISTPRYEGDKTVIRMDYIQGRQCKTFVRRVDQGHFTLNNRSYECDRGVPDPMLDRAKEILTGKQGTGPVSTSYMYKGESLTLRLKEYGFARKPGESDWHFRKRVFPDLLEMDDGRAMEFLLGSSAAEWNEIDKTLYISIISFIRENNGKPNRNALIKFVDDFPVDPLKMR